jgi:hypothetical protein
MENWFPDADDEGFSPIAPGFIVILLILVDRYIMNQPDFPFKRQIHAVVMLIAGLHLALAIVLGILYQLNKK